jgi:ubiquinone/menaquinone biosynthesis C-methylase UbiE
MNDDKKIKNRYDRIAPIYDSLEWLMEKAKMREWRKNFWDKVKSRLPIENGKILEAGVGTGKNIKYYPEDIEIYAIDFSENMIKESKIKLEKYYKKANLVKMDIQDLDFPDNYFDIIVTSCVFCSVPDPVKGLRELKRVLKKDGSIFMLEHVKSQNRPVGKLMDYFNWVSLYTWGANINRETVKNIKKADLKIVKVKNIFYDIVKEIELTK